MNGARMADTDVQKELAVLGEIAKHHSKTIDKLLVFQDKQLILAQKQIYQDEKIDNIIKSILDMKSEQKEIKVEVIKNHTSIKIFCGVFASLTTIITIACQIFRLIP